MCIAAEKSEAEGYYTAMTTQHSLSLSLSLSLFLSNAIYINGKILLRLCDLNKDNHDENSSFSFGLLMLMGESLSSYIVHPTLYKVSLLIST
jgi:hypothetical protein